MTTSTQITPEAALAKFNAFVQSQQMQDYLSQRQQQYGTTPKGAASDKGWTAGESYTNPFAGLKEFGSEEKPTLNWNAALGEAGEYESGTQTQQKSAYDILKGAFNTEDSIFGHKSTFTKAYSTSEKDAKGNPIEIKDPTLEDIQSGKVAFLVGGKTGGESRERMAQMYLPMGDKLVPIGDPQYYKGEHPDAKNVANALKIASIASLPFGGIGAFLGPVTGTVTSGLASLGLPAMAANIGANALVSGGLNAGIAKLVDMDAGKAFKSGATSGAIGAGLGELGAMSGLDKGLGALYAPAKSIATSGLTSAVLGKPFNFSEAAKNAALSFGLQQALGSTDLAPKQGEALNKFLEFLGRKP
tara:strand:- start:1301 stop:2374 length:1074 start_codon:yes stop_codon:yes gene_type:complete